MSPFNRAAALAVIAGALVAVPAAAQTGKPARAVASDCVRDLGGAQCGLLQDRLVKAAARTTGDRAHPAAVIETGRRQLDVLIDTIS